MDSAEVSQPNGAHKDEETTKVEAHVSLTVPKKKDEGMSPARMLPSDVSRQLSEMQIVSWHLLSDIQNKISTIQEEAVLHKSKLGQAYRSSHRLLEIEEERRLIENKHTEDKVVNELEDKALKLVGLMQELEKTIETKQQISIIDAQLKTLKTLARFEVELDGYDSPVQSRTTKEMQHMVKPMLESILFDPESAHPNLILSVDRRQVRFQACPQMREPSKQCFQPGLYVLGMPGFQSGRHYWEVDVGKKSNWIIGVVRESVERKGAWELHSSNGYWVLRKKDDNVFYGIGDTHSNLQLKTLPLRIGVCLDLFRSQLSFYDADTANLIFQLSICLVQEKLFPFFCPGIPVREEDWCPLTLCM
ncbi:nuclear factor 7, brain-like isoform X2 [Pseudophryne corroboree]|uniref:nuclear factor 7, brain-like isoform X2 n=1 Tax=Pseudophryne corroboree TaxID=495146 RepID=UPI0030818D12